MILRPTIPPLDWSARFRASHAEYLRRRARAKQDREQETAGRPAGLEIRHATKTRRNRAKTPSSKEDTVTQPRPIAMIISSSPGADGVRYHAHCPYCGETHVHGGTIGPRRAPCKPDTGYLLAWEDKAGEADCGCTGRRLCPQHQQALPARERAAYQRNSGRGAA